jgi:F0F1-type ATP synthase membrane subunit b/b'
MDKKAAELEATVEKTLKTARADADAIISEAKVETGKMIQEAERKPIK